MLGACELGANVCQHRLTDPAVARLLAPMADLVESGWREYFTIESEG